MSKKTKTVAPNYIEVILHGIARDEYDEISMSLFDLGAEGVVEDLKFSQPNLVEDPIIIETDFLDLKAFFKLDDFEQVKAKIAQSYSKYKATCFVKESEDWMENWKKFYKPIELSDEFTIVPSWLAKDFPAEKSVLINPGLAFGTGTHATTLLCLAAIQKLLKSQTILKALDYGAGTGILSILMNKIGMEDLTCVEIDEMALEKCEENLVLNEMSSDKIFHPSDMDNNLSYDLVVANIIDAVLMNISNTLRNHSSKYLLLSGVLDENENVVLNEYCKDGSFEVLEKTYSGEWCCFLLKRTS